MKQFKLNTIEEARKFEVCPPQSMLPTNEQLLKVEAGDWVQITAGKKSVSVKITEAHAGGEADSLFKVFVGTVESDISGKGGKVIPQLKRGAIIHFEQENIVRIFDFDNGIRLPTSEAMKRDYEWRRNKYANLNKG